MFVVFVVGETWPVTINTEWLKPMVKESLLIFLQL